MNQPDKLTVTLREDQAERIRQSVANGGYASAEDFVASAIDGFDDNSDWLPDKDTLKRLVDEALNDPRPPLTIEEVRARLDARFESALAEEEARALKHGAA